VSSQVSLLLSLHSSCERKRSLTNLKGVAFRNSIPTGLRLKAQGCEPRATLGNSTNELPTPTGLRLIDYDRQTSKVAAPKNISELGSLATGALRSFHSHQDRIRCT